MTDLHNPFVSTAVPILLVDDKPANILALQAVLASPEYELAVASSGADALRLIEQRDFAVVLLDVQMPHMDGFETASQMKQLAGPERPLPIIFVTGIDGTPSRIIRAYAEGGADFIQKPLDPEMMRAKVSVFAELYRARQRIVTQQAKAQEERLRLAKEASRREVAETGLTFVRMVIDNLPALAWTALPDGHVDFYNQRWYEFTGTTLGEMVGWGWQRVHDPTILPTVVERWKSALSTGEPFEMEFPLRDANGVFRWFLTRIHPLRDANGAIVRWIGTNTNVDEFRKLREALANAAENERRARQEVEVASRSAAQLREALLRTAEAERERLETMFHESPAGICLLRGHDFTIEFANPHILDLWGKSVAVVGQPLMEAVPELRGQGFDDPLRGQGFDDPLRGVLKTGVAYHGKEVLARLDRNRDGALQDVYLDFVQVPLRTPDGTIDGVFVHAYEVTDKVVARHHIEGLREEAMRAVRTREDVLAIVSHDLRNPLSNVVMAANLIEHVMRDEGGSLVQAKRALKTILESVDRMNRLVGDLLDMAKLETGQSLPVDLGTHDVAALTRNTTELLAPLVSSRHLTLTTDLAAPCYALCDSDRLHQALSNLIGNAIKFTREGGSIRVGARRTEREILVSVNDTGVGIPEDQVPHLFEAYWQADAQRRDGAGLGLSIVKAIVEAHGGRVWVETALGKGSTFYFTLRAADTIPAAKDER
jgi:PAS domain S-box-containing protein